MKKLFLAIAVFFAAAVFVPTESKAMVQSVEDVYRDLQVIVYGQYGGSQAGIDAGNRYLEYQGYSINVWDVFSAWDMWSQWYPMNEIPIWCIGMFY